MKVMVEWWPWWVSSLLAVAVAAASAAAFFRARRAFVRGILATLVAEGIAAAVLAPVLMDDMTDEPMNGGTARPAMGGGAMGARDDLMAGRPPKNQPTITLAGK